MFFQEFLTNCTGSLQGAIHDQGDVHDGGGQLTVEDALCQLYTTLSLHHTAPSFSKLIPLLQVSCLLHCTKIVVIYCNFNVLQNVCNCLPAAKGTPYVLKALDQALEAAVSYSSCIVNNSWLSL